MHVAKSINNPDLGIARVVVYTHSSLVVKRREDLEDESLSAVWLEVGMPRQRKILVATMYIFTKLTRHPEAFQPNLKDGATS